MHAFLWYNIMISYITKFLTITRPFHLPLLVSIHALSLYCKQACISFSIFANNVFILNCIPYSVLSIFNRNSFKFQLIPSVIGLLCNVVCVCTYF